jgi:hypothetical protein
MFYPMKRIFVFLTMALVTGSGLVAQKHPRPVSAASMVAPAPQEVIDLKELTFDFGKIPQGRPVTHHFELVNKGKAPLMLDNVQASCGCTTPEWSEAPIASGASSVIKVGFNAASEGHFTKTITITYNSGMVKTFTISGEVYPSPTTSAPLNASLSLLK